VPTYSEISREIKMRADARAAFPDARTDAEAMVKFVQTPEGRRQHEEFDRAKRVEEQYFPKDVIGASIVSEAERSALSLDAFLRTPKGRALYKARANLLKGRGRAKRP
jgi:hypothetical protein